MDWKSSLRNYPKITKTHWKFSTMRDSFMKLALKLQHLWIVCAKRNPPNVFAVNIVGSTCDGSSSHTEQFICNRYKWLLRAGRFFNTQGYYVNSRHRTGSRRINATKLLIEFIVERQKIIGGFAWWISEWGRVWNCQFFSWQRRNRMNHFGLIVAKLFMQTHPQ